MIRLTILLIILYTSISFVPNNTIIEEKIKGITLVAPPKPFTSDPIPNIKSVNASWIAVVPFGFTKKGNNTVSHSSPWQWWGRNERWHSQVNRTGTPAKCKSYAKAPDLYPRWVGWRS